MGELAETIGFDAGAFSGVLPLFPLPNAVLFPDAILPLHVFEPRYRELVRDVSEGEGLIGISLLKSGWEDDYHSGEPALHSVGCVGQLLDRIDLPDGRFNIVLGGLARYRVVDELKHRSYRQAKVELVGDYRPSKDMGPRMLEKIHVLKELTKRIPESMFRSETACVTLQKLELSLSGYVDMLANALHLSFDSKQEILSEMEPAKRAVILIREIGRTRERMSLCKRPRYPVTPSSN